MPIIEAGIGELGEMGQPEGVDRSIPSGVGIERHGGGER
jgi:hypothetical protein